MMRAYFTLAALLVCSACSTPAPPGPPPSTAAEGPPHVMGLEALVILDKLPTPTVVSVTSLKPRYPDKAAFLADLQATRPDHAIELDGKGVWSGFGPASRYRTNDDGSVSR